MGAETDQRRAFLYQRRDHDLSPFAVRHILAGRRVNDLKVNIIIPIVHARVIFTVNADARAIDLGQTIDVIQLDSKLIMDSLTHLVAPALGSEDTLL